MWTPSPQTVRRWPLLAVPLFTFLLWHAGKVYHSGGDPDAVGWLPSTFSSNHVSGEDHHVFLYTKPVWHEEVWLSLGGMLTNMKVPYTAYVECDTSTGSETCVRFGLLDIAKKMGQWTGVVRKKEQLFDHVNMLLPNGRLVDTVILATEKEDMDYASDRLFKLWRERPDDQKFKLVAIYHEPTGDVEKYARKWAPTGALSYLTLSPHVAQSLRIRLRKEAANMDGAHAGVDQIPVRTVVPWMPAAESNLFSPLDGSLHRTEHKLPSVIVINGMISPERRAYDQVYKDMSRHFMENAELFGYRWSASQTRYVPIDENDPNRFRLLVLGEKDQREDHLPDPGHVRLAVEYIDGYEQTTFYEYMASADLLMLAWNDGYRYLDSQASSSSFTTLETEVPLITTELMTEQYTFLDDSIAVIRPNSLPEMDVIALFRQFPDVGRMSDDDLTKQLHKLYPGEIMHSRVVPHTVKMLRQGWKRPARNWVRKKAALRKEDYKVLAEILTEPLY